MSRRGLALVALWALGACVAFSPAKGGDLQLDGERVAVPLQLDDGVPLVNVWVGTHGPFLFKLDTGSGPSVVAERLAARLRLPTYSSQARLSGANGKTRQVERVAELASLRLGTAASLRDVRAFVLPGEEFDVHDARRPVEGILGYSAFLDCTLVLDLPRRLMVLSAAPLPEQGSLPLALDRSTPRLLAPLAGRPFDLLIDTGNDQSLILPPSAADLPFVDSPARGPVLATVSGLTAVKVARLAGDLQLGAHAVPQPIVTLMECSGPMLGAEILRHFRVSLDARHKRVRFERDLDTPIVLPARLSDGLGLRRAGQVWEVVDVIPGSSAERAGIRAGDAVRAVEYQGDGAYRVEVGQHGVYRQVILQREVLVR